MRKEDRSTPQVLFPEAAQLDTRIITQILHQVRERPALVIVEVNFIDRENGEVTEEYAVYLLGTNDVTGQTTYDDMRVRKISGKNVRKDLHHKARVAFGTDRRDDPSRIPNRPFSIHCFDKPLPSP